MASVQNCGTASTKTRPPRMSRVASGGHIRRNSMGCGPLTGAADHHQIVVERSQIDAGTDQLLDGFELMDMCHLEKRLNLMLA